MSNSEYINICKPLKSTDDIIRIINSKNHFREVVEERSIPCYAASIADTMEKVSPTQMRRFYSYVKNIEQINRHKDDDSIDILHRHKLTLLLPKLAGSSERKNLLLLCEVVQACVDKISNVGDVRAFVDFFEAILDFHSTIDRKKED